MNISIKTAYHLYKDIIEYYFNNYYPVYELEGNIEIDEVFLCGKEKYNNGNNSSETFVIFGMKCRENGDFLFFHVANKSEEELHPIIIEFIKEGSTIYSDKMATYFDNRNNISKLSQYGYRHLTTNHRLYFVDPRNNSIHSNGIERLWSMFRSSISHIRRSVNPQNIGKEIAKFYFSIKIPDDEKLKNFLIFSKYYFNQ
jgi:hypothetical protein